MTKCMECPGELREATFVFERADDAGRLLRKEVSGYRCASCGVRVLTGRDAEQISHEWRELTETPS